MNRYSKMLVMIVLCAMEYLVSTTLLYIPSALLYGRWNPRNLNAPPSLLMYIEEVNDKSHLPFGAEDPKLSRHFDIAHHRKGNQKICRSPAPMFAYVHRG